MVYLERVLDGAGGKVAAKLELMEPCCSVKDRWATQHGLLAPYPHSTDCSLRTSPPFVHPVTYPAAALSFALQPFLLHSLHFHTMPLAK